MLLIGSWGGEVGSRAHCILRKEETKKRQKWKKLAPRCKHPSLGWSAECNCLLHCTQRGRSTGWTSPKIYISPYHILHTQSYISRMFAHFREEVEPFPCHTTIIKTHLFIGNKLGRRKNGLSQLSPLHQTRSKAWSSRCPLCWRVWSEPARGFLKSASH